MCGTATWPYSRNMAIRVVLYVRHGCHLCDDARTLVRQVCEDTGTHVTEVDVDADPQAQALYGDQVPLVTVDGTVAGFWRIDPTVLRQALA